MGKPLLKATQIGLFTGSPVTPEWSYDATERAWTCSRCARIRRSTAKPGRCGCVKLRRRVISVEPGRHRLYIGDVLVGEVQKWPDGAWIAYIVGHDGKVIDENAGEAGTLHEAVRDMYIHLPEGVRPARHRGKHLHDPAMREAEAESRAAFPDEWAWHDKVCELLRDSS